MLPTKGIKSHSKVDWPCQDITQGSSREKPIAQAHARILACSSSHDRYDTNKPISFKQRVENLKRVAERKNVDIDLSNLYLKRNVGGHLPLFACFALGNPLELEAWPVVDYIVFVSMTE